MLGGLEGVRIFGAVGYKGMQASTVRIIFPSMREIPTKM